MPKPKKRLSRKPQPRAGGVEAIVPLRADIPKVTHKAIKKLAVDEETTLQRIVLRALKKYGIPVPDKYLLD